MGKQWKRPKHGKTMESAETWENGLNVKNRWNGKTRLRVTVESAENVGKRWPHGQKRGKTVVAWPETWENGGRMAEVE